MSSKVRVYTVMGCPFCTLAKELLSQKRVAFEEFDVTGDPAARDRLRRETGRHTVPQIFIGARSIGGFTDLSALDRRGELDRLLEE